jgi:hypothetical protein
MPFGHDPAWKQRRQVALGKRAAVVIGMERSSAFGAADVARLQGFPVRHADQEITARNTRHFHGRPRQHAVRKMLQHLAAQHHVKAVVAERERGDIGQHLFARREREAFGGAVERDDAAAAPQPDRGPAGPAARVEDRQAIGRREGLEQMRLATTVRRLQRPPIEALVERVNPVRHADFPASMPSNARLRR